MPPNIQMALLTGSVTKAKSDRGCGSRPLGVESTHTPLEYSIVFERSVLATVAPPNMITSLWSESYVMVAPKTRPALSVVSTFAQFVPSHSMLSSMAEEPEQTPPVKKTFCVASSKAIVASLAQGGRVAGVSCFHAEVEASYAYISVADLSLTPSMMI